jgi:hypothetical protein
VWKVRQEQEEALAQVELRRFDERARRHLNKHFPRQVGPMTAGEFRQWVRQCVERAGRYGLETEQAVMCFAHLLLLLGDDFETNPRYGFAPTVLRADYGHQNERAKLAMLLAYEVKARGL